MHAKHQNGCPARRVPCTSDPPPHMDDERIEDERVEDSNDQMKRKQPLQNFIPIRL